MDLTVCAAVHKLSEEQLWRLSDDLTKEATKLGDFDEKQLKQPNKYEIAANSKDIFTCVLQ